MRTFNEIGDYLADLAPIWLLGGFILFGLIMIGKAYELPEDPPQSQE